MKNKIKNNNGFTLIELLVVVLIIGVLAAIALPQYRKTVAKSQLAQILMATKSVNSASKMYYLTNDNYANHINDLDIKIDSGITCGVSTSASYCFNKKFALWKSSISAHLECAAKTQDENSALANACRELVKKPNCYLTESASTCVVFLKLKPCFICKGTNTM